MANQNAEQNAPATTTDSTQQGDVDNDFASVSPSSAENDDDGDDNAHEAPPRRSRDDEEERELYIPPRGPQGELVEALKPQGEDAERKEVANGRPYEIVFIVRNTHADNIEAITQRTRDLIEGTGGAVDNVRTSEVRRFSYPIEKEVEGSYVVLNARYTTTVVKELDRFFKLEEGVIRHLIVREDV